MKRIFYSVLSILLILTLLLVGAPLPAWAETELDPLMQLYAASLQNAPLLKTFLAQNEALRHEIEALQSERWLKLNLDLMPTASISAVQKNNVFQPGFRVSNTFDLANKKGFEVQIKELQRLRNISQYQQVLKSYFSQLCHAYFQWRYYRDLRLLHQVRLEKLEMQAQLLKTGVEKGAFPSLDLARVKIEVLNQQVLLNQDQMEILKLQQTLLQLTGLEKMPVGRFEAFTQDAALGLLESNYLEHSPELTLLAYDKAELLVGIVQEQSAWFPELVVSETDSYYLSPPNYSGLTLQTQINLSFPLLNGGRGPRIEAQKAKISALELSSAQAKRVLETEFRHDQMTLHVLTKNLKLLEKARVQARQNLEQMQAGYARHFVDLTSLLSAHRDWLVSETQYLQAEADFAQTIQRLRHLTQGDIYL